MSLASRRRADLSAPGLIVAAAIFALFAVDAARAAPVRVSTTERPIVASAAPTTLDVDLAVDADTAPTFQVFRGRTAGQWIVELPGVDLAGVDVTRVGPDVLLQQVVVEPARSGAAA
ncbi:MAG TPA: hypothetical protein VGF99_16010, partial [Myxococcota bacterium]